MEKYSLFIFIIGIASIIITKLLGVDLNGRNVIDLRIAYVTPAYIAVPLFVIAFTGLLNRYNIENLKNVATLLGLAFISMICIHIDHSDGILVILAITYLILAIIKIFSKEFKGDKRKILAIFASVLVGSSLLIITQEYSMKTFLVFINPYADLQSGWQLIQFKNARDHSALFGRGDPLYSDNMMKIGGGVESNVVFTYIVANFGWIIAISIIFLIILLSLIMIKDSTKIKDIYGKNLIVAISAMLILQCLFNILFNLGLAPTLMAVKLPFIGYGGESVIIDMILISIILSVYRRKNLIFNNSNMKVV